MNRTRIASAALLGSITLLAATGCKSSTDHYSYSAITANLTPELQGIAERPVDVHTNVAVAENVNWRLMWGDLGRVWYMDRPSILSPFPTVSTSGQPQ
ncbi:MAG: hypothetical protein MK082_12135 [Phycisphaerales bacterium]|nr:hypothetical protein [Phycisphaerales bacterium]